MPKLLKAQTYKDWSKGVWRSVSAALAPENSSRMALNLDSDVILGDLMSRKGSTLIGSQLLDGASIYGLHNYRVVERGAGYPTDKIFASVSDGTNNDIYDVSAGTKSLEDDTVDLKTRFLTYLNSCLRLNGTDEPKAWNGTTWDSAENGAFVNELLVLDSSLFTAGLDNVITYYAHSLSDGDRVILTTTGILPTGLSLNTLYYVGVLSEHTINFYTDADLTQEVDITLPAGGSASPSASPSRSPSSSPSASPSISPPSSFSPSISKSSSPSRSASASPSRSPSKSPSTSPSAGSTGSLELNSTHLISEANLKAYYRFGASTLGTDASGNGHNLTNINWNAVTADASGQFAGAAAFPGSGGYSAVEHTDLKPTQDFSVGGWVKTSHHASYQSIFQSYSNHLGNEKGIRLYLYNGKIALSSHCAVYPGANDAYVFGGTSIMDGDWHFVVGTWDGSYLRVYVDGVLDASPVAYANDPSYEFDFDNYVRIGCRKYKSDVAEDQFLTGSLDDIFLFKGTALNSTDIEGLWDGSMNSKSPSVSPSVSRSVSPSPAPVSLSPSASTSLSPSSSISPSTSISVSPSSSPSSSPSVSPSIGIIGTGEHTWTRYTTVLSSLNHGLENGDMVKLTTNDSLPLGLEEDTPYFVIEKTTHTFKLSLTSGGAAVNVGNVGSGTNTWQRWDAFDLSNFPEDAKYAIEFKDRIYVAGSLTSPDRVDISGIADSTNNVISWTDDNRFIVFEQEDGGGGITGFAKVPGYLMVFKERTLKRYNGASTFPEDLINQGAPSQEAIAVAMGMCFWINGNDAWVSEGGAPKSIGSFMVREIIKSLSPAVLPFISAGTDEEHVFWSIPYCTIDGETFSNLVLKYNILQSSWDIRKYPTLPRVFTKVLDDSLGEILAYGDNDGNVLSMDYGTSDNGTAIPYSLETQDWDFGLRMFKKGINRMVVITENVSKGTLMWRSSHNSEDWKVVGTISHEVEDFSGLDLRGNFYNFKITESTSTGQARIIGFEFPEGIRLYD